MQMTVTEGLVQLKTLDARINKEISTIWIFTLKNTDDETDKVENAKAKWVSVNDLIKRRAAIKAAIVKSNALVEVQVGKQTMTVAEAIETKASIGYLKALRLQLISEAEVAEKEFTRYSDLVQQKVDQLLAPLMGSDKNDIKAEQEAVAENYKKRNGVKLIDPIKAREKAQELSETIADFEANVDIALSLSNAKTIIEVE